MDYTPLTLNQIDDLEGSSLFVINTLNSATNADGGGKFCFTVFIGNKNETIVLENTWIPVDLSIQAKKSAILDNSDWRRAVTSGKIHCLRPEEALAILSTPEAQAEFQTVYKTSAVQKAISIGEKSPGVQVVTQSATISPKIMSLVAKLHNEEISSVEAITLLRGSKNISDDDLRYLLANCTDVGVKKYVSTCLNKA